MKPFNLEQALAGAQVMFRNGKIVDEVFYSATLKSQPVIIIDGSSIRQHNKDGKYYVGPHDESEYDLFMAPVKREGWLIKRKDIGTAVLSTMIFDTEEAAKLSLSGDKYEYIKIEWEE